MEKVLVDVEVIKGILNAYTRADKNQSRIYGLILGSKKNNIYRITEAIYGFIFEGEEDPKTSKKELKSSYTLNRGEVLVLSGINKDTTYQKRNGIPFLKDIPIIQYLFSINSDYKASSVISLSIEAY